MEALLPHSDPRAADLNGMTPLMVATSLNDPELILALLPGSDAKARDARGRSALMKVVHGKIAPRPAACVRLLVAASDLNAEDDEGSSALDIAIKHKHWAAADIIAANMRHFDARRLLNVGGFNGVDRAAFPQCLARIEQFEIQEAMEKNAGKKASNPIDGDKAQGLAPPTSRRLCRSATICGAVWRLMVRPLNRSTNEIKR